MKQDTIENPNAQYIMKLLNTINYWTAFLETGPYNADIALDVERAIQDARRELDYLFEGKSENIKKNER